MNQYCVPLSIVLNPCLKDPTDFATYNLNPKIVNHVTIPLEDISQEYKDFLASYGLELLLAEMFYLPPRTVTNVHTDVAGGDYSKINFIFGGSKSVMCWYQPKDGVNKSVETNVINKKVVNYHKSEVSLVHKEHVHSPSIVQVGIPHNIVVNAERRWCISTVYVRADTKKRLTMDETIALFAELIK
jgi:hypothetical protein